MAFRLRNPFRKSDVHVDPDVAGLYGFGAPLQIVYKHRPLPPVDNNGQNSYQTYLSPRYTPIGGGIPNKREISPYETPSVSTQGVLVAQIGSPGILSGTFASAPLLNVTTTESNSPIPNFDIPAA